MSMETIRLGIYELHERLGQGGMSEVWKAWDTRLQRYVAIKVLRPDLQTHPDFAARFLREARLVASLRHPNIIQVYDFQVAPSSAATEALPYIVMEYIGTYTFANHLQRGSGIEKLATNDLIQLFTAISNAVDYAHQQGVVHRDLKPTNILLDTHHATYCAFGEPILTDFGIARLSGTTTGLLSGTWQGTAEYLSPEQIKGYPGNDLSDIYALGVLLYQLCTGRLPFQGENPAAIVQQHINTMPPPPALVNPNIPPALSVVLLRSLAKEPAARFQSASALT